jgi:hypothetical protein
MRQNERNKFAMVNLIKSPQEFLAEGAEGGLPKEF